MIEQRWKIGNFCAHMVRPSDHCQITGVKGQEYGQCGVILIHMYSNLNSIQILKPRDIKQLLK